MAQIDINPWAVLVAAILNMAIGALWYAPFLFGRSWVSAMRDRDSDMDKLKKNAHEAHIVALLGALISSFVLAHFIDYAGATTAIEGMKVGAWCWFGFVAATAITSTLYEGRSKKFYFLNVGYYLVAFLVMGAVLAVWA